MSAHRLGKLTGTSLSRFVSMTAAFALHLHGECRWVCVKCFAGRFAGWLLLNRGWMAAPSYDLGQCCNYGMAVWEREGEDKAIWRGGGSQAV